MALIKTDAQKKAQKNYMSKYIEVKVRMTPEKRNIIQEHASSRNESTTAFINRAIDEAMERDAANPATVLEDTHPASGQ